MTRETISVLVTDLDNTLFDWLDVWHRSFGAMVDALVDLSGLPRDRLLDDIGDVHRRHGTSEYAFVIDEIASLRAMHPAGDLGAIYAGAVEARRDARDAALRLYPGVRETLSTLREAGTLIIGYTESLAFYTGSRVRALGLDDLLDLLYSPADHELPPGRSRDRIRRHPPAHYDFHHTVHHHTPAGELKPNPRLLLDILEDAGASAEQAVYVGDSPLKDIAMARDARVRDVLALYGKAPDGAAYELLRRVTHWTPEQVARERATLARGAVAASYTLRHSFAELLTLFQPARFARSA